MIVFIFSGEEFLAGSFAAKILSAKVVVGAVNRILAYQICVPYKRDKEVLISTVCGAIFNLFANALLIPKVGVTGASVATLFSEGVVFVVLTYYSSRFFATRVLYTRFPVYLMASVWFLVVRYVMNLIFENVSMVLAGTVIVCVIGYFTVLLLIKDPYLKGTMEQMLRRWKVIR